MTTVQTGPVRQADAARRDAPAVSVRRRRSTPHIVLGALLVVACAVAFAVTALRVDPRTAVLALARSVPAGHTLSAADLTVVRIVPDSRNRLSALVWVVAPPASALQARKAWNSDSAWADAVAVASATIEQAARSHLSRITAESITRTI